MDAAPLYVPPMPPVPERELSFRAFLRAMRTNALTMWPRPAYEEPVRYGRFFHRTSMLLNDPTGIHRVLVDNHANYARSPASIRLLRPLVGNGLLLSEGDDWRLQRRTIAPALAPRVMPLLVPHILSVARETVAALGDAVGTQVDLLTIVQRTALEIAARSMFSMGTQDFADRLRAMVFDYGMNYARPHLLDVALPPSVPTPGDLWRMTFRRRWLRFIEGVVAAREAIDDGREARDLFDLLRVARDPETGQGFTRAQLRDQVATIILAGHETTGATIFWALTLLARAPDFQARVAAEVRGKDLAANPDLPVTRAVVNETLRLYPPAFTLGRFAKAADRAGEVAIPRGAIILIAPWVLHRHKQNWTRPEAFDPGRFLPGAPPPARFAFMPFGAGPRICVGAQFALVEATLVLAALMQEFEVSMDETEPVLPVGVVVTQPDRAPAFRLRRRSSSAGAESACPSSTTSAAIMAN